MEETVKDLEHFSHEHPLIYVKSSHLDTDRVCSCCKLTIKPNKFFYHCKVCQFSLHKVCYNMPKMVVHPADLNHQMTLLASTVTGQTAECAACGRGISGFYYTCTKCSVYYHTLCVAIPLSVKIPSSHPHVLKLEVKPPYDFQCDLCERPSYRGWLYRCRLCEFDVHISCVVSFKETDQSQKYSLEDDVRLGDSKSHQNELMELLSERMKGIKGNPNKKLDQGQIRQPLDQSTLVSKDSTLVKPDKGLGRGQFHQPLNQSTPFSEEFTLPSYQFSDACFSIDIAKSIGIEGKNTNEADHKHAKEIIEVAKRQSFKFFSEKDLKRELSFAPLPAIGSNVWKELGQDSEKGSSNVNNESIHLKDQSTKIVNVNSRRSFWTKLLMCT